MKRFKQIVAIICVILLVSMYLVTLIMAILDSSASKYMFRGCLLTTIFLPIAAYAAICLHKYAMTRSGRKNYYDQDISNDSTKIED